MRSLRYNIFDIFARCLPVVSGVKSTFIIYIPGHLGDLLHAVPMLKALRAGKPAARIVWLVGPWSEALARRYAGDVDEIRIFGPNLPQFTRGRAEWRQAAWTQWSLVRDLRREAVDCLIAPADAVGRFLANAIGPKRWIGIGEWRPPRVRAEIQTHFQPYEKDRYEADALCGMLAPLGIAAHADRLEYVITPKENQEAAEFLKTSKVDSGRPLGLIAPGSGWSGKNWFPERFREVAEWLTNEKQFQVAWVGNAEEAELLPSGRARDLNWMGQTSLTLLAAVLPSARLYVGNDSGLLHLAAALDVPTVSIWGPTSPAKWGPRGARHLQIRKIERCENCIYWDYRESCRHNHVCMEAVTSSNVIDAIRKILEWGP